MTTPPALAMQGITKRFGGVVALADAGIVVRPGTVHALLGENGAGKTTLMRIAFGLVRADSGSVAIAGRVRRLRSPAEAIAAGLGMVQQQFALVGVMSVADNVALGLPGPYGARAAGDRVRALVAETGLELDPEAEAGGLSVEAQQRLEIVKALARKARVLILDEPTAVLAPSAAAELLRWLRRFADGGGSAVLITHKLGEALGVSDDITVLRRGRTVLATGAVGVSEGELAAAMLGGGGLVGTQTSGSLRATRTREVSTQGHDAEQASGTEDALGGPWSAGPIEIGKVGMGTDRVAASDPYSSGAPARAKARSPVIVAEGIRLVDARGVVKIVDASFVVRAGEIVGVAAVEGVGQHELMRALAGRGGVAAGRLTRPDRVGFVPEDRQRDALVGRFPLFENVALRGVGRRRGRMSWGRERAESRDLLRAFDVRASSVSVPAATLSGGNQQKLVLARELAGQPLAIVVENPTRGLDIRATAAIHDRLRAARDAGTAVVAYASDIDEVVGLADRVLVVARRGVREVAVDREEVGRAMLGISDW